MNSMDEEHLSISKFPFVNVLFIHIYYVDKNMFKVHLMFYSEKKFMDQVIESSTHVLLLIVISRKRLYYFHFILNEK